MQNPKNKTAKNLIKFSAITLLCFGMSACNYDTINCLAQASSKEIIVNGAKSSSTSGIYSCLNQGAPSKEIIVNGASSKEIIVNGSSAPKQSAGSTRSTSSRFRR